MTETVLTYMYVTIQNVRGNFLLKHMHPHQALMTLYLSYVLCIEFVFLLQADSTKHSINFHYSFFALIKFLGFLKNSGVLSVLVLEEKNYSWVSLFLLGGYFLLGGS